MQPPSKRRRLSAGSGDGHEAGPSATAGEDGRHDSTERFGPELDVEIWDDYLFSSTNPPAQGTSGERGRHVGPPDPGPPRGPNASGANNPWTSPQQNAGPWDNFASDDDENDAGSEYSDGYATSTSSSWDVVSQSGSTGAGIDIDSLDIYASSDDDFEAL